MEGNEWYACNPAEAGSNRVIQLLMASPCSLTHMLQVKLHPARAQVRPSNVAAPLVPMYPDMSPVTLMLMLMFMLMLVCVDIMTPPFRFRSSIIDINPKTPHSSHLISLSSYAPFAA